MAKYRVVRAFRDRELNKTFLRGQVYPSGIADERLDVLLDNGVIELLPAKAPNVRPLLKDNDELTTEGQNGREVAENSSEDVQENDKVEEAEESVKPTEENTVAEIKAYLNEHNIDYAGLKKKADLLKLAD